MESPKTELENKNSDVLPEGNIFGDIEDDEFVVELNGEPKGVFKRFEYLTMPFSITGEDELEDEVISAAELNGTSFGHELRQNNEAERVVNDVHERMEEKPAFSKELMDSLLADIYVDDNVIAQMDAEENLEAELGKFIAGWKHLSDFYGIEGLVGGDAEEINPFLGDEGAMIAGGLDTLETKLPAMRKDLATNEWKETLLQISSIVERDYEQIDRGVDVLEDIHGVGEYSKEDIQDSRDTLDELSSTRLETNLEFGKFYNTFIRFHNWVPLNITSEGPEGDAYDSICAPADQALERTEGKIYESLSEIGDATSPKGLALAWLVEDEVEVEGGVLGDASELEAETRDFEQRIDEQLQERREGFEVMDYDDPAMYPALVGGKWKGLKLLEDTRDIFDLDYKMPEAKVITSIGIDNVLEKEGIDRDENLFSIDEESRNQIINSIESVDLERFLESTEDNIIARSSMYGEDGASNFAGTYESFAASHDLDKEEAVRNVVQSYYSPEAVNAREDKGLTHSGGMAVILQENIHAERGGVIHLKEDNYSVSEADHPEEAVEGKGSRNENDDLEAVLEGTAIENMSDDLYRLHSIFGDIDIEYVHDGDEVYLTQMRPKHDVVRDERRINGAENYLLESFEDMYETELEGNKNYVVRMEFLGRDNVMDKERDINEFIRENQENIEAIEGHMPTPAHIPNNIEGHFRIPYRQI